ncbi:Hypothetical protein HVR_LOCUS1106 [uncultured virus]|nr:Hypothetical protein HVR_LOCUS1106 [uncultured virus]
MSSNRRPSNYRRIYIQQNNKSNKPALVAKVEEIKSSTPVSVSVGKGIVQSSQINPPINSVNQSYPPKPKGCGCKSPYNF